MVFRNSVLWSIHRGLFGTLDKTHSLLICVDWSENKVIPAAVPANAYGLERITMFSNKARMSTRN